MTEILVTSIGTGSYQSVTYELDGRTYATALPAKALLQGRAPQERVLVLATNAAWEKNRSLVEGELSCLCAALERVEIPEGRTPEEIDRIFNTIVGVVPADSVITLDVTYALRSLQFISLASLAYLVNLRNCTIKAIVYGNYELRDRERGVAPIVDITQLFALVEFYAALGISRETGFAAPLASLFQRILQPIVRDKTTPRPLKENIATLTRNFADLARARSNVALAETGVFARYVLRQMDQLSHNSVMLPSIVSYALTALRSDEIEKSAVPVGELTEAKDRLRLDVPELQRQLWMASRYLENGNLVAATIALREITVSAYILFAQGGENWLRKDVRHGAEHALGSAAKRCQARVGSSQDRLWSGLFNKAAEIRNRYAHGWMREDSFTEDKRGIRTLISGLEALIADPPKPEPIRAGTLAIAPFGLSRGTLYTLLSRRPADTIVIVCSRESQRDIDTVMQLFECKPDVVPVVVADPFAGVDELLEQIRQTLPAVQERLSRVRTVVHCVTGGTTLLGYGATRFADEARRLGLSVTTVAAVDRRSPEEQRQRPFELGELVELPGPHTETFGSSNPVEDDA